MTETKTKTGDQVRSNNQAAQQTASSQPSGCKVCERPGLPILPLRYAVVPKGNRQGSGPALHSTLGEGILAVTLPGGTHEYALRALRQGYVYVLLDKKTWQGYEVTTSGLLRQFDPYQKPHTHPQPLPKACKTKGHDIPAQFLNIDIEKFKQAWVAFSQDAWTKTVLDEYKNGKRPNDRFLKLDLKKIKSTPDAEQHTFELDPSLKRLSQGVEEYVKNHSKFHSVHGFDPRFERMGDLRNYVEKQKQLYKGKVAAIVLMDHAGMVQELNASRLEVVEQRQRYASTPEIARKNIISNSILGLKEVVTQAANNSARQETGVELPLLEGSSMDDSPSTPEDEARATWAKMEKFYKEGQRATFAKEYKRKLDDYQKQIDAIGKDYSAWASRLDWMKLFKDYDSNDVKSSLSLTSMAAPCLSGGPTDQTSLQLWIKWLNQSPTGPGNPVYAALFGERKNLQQYLTPEGENLNKADKLYDTIKGLAGTSEYEKHLKEPGLAAISHLQLAIAGAVSMAGDKLTKNGEAIAVRAQQAALLLYQKVEVTMLKISMTIGEYHKFLSELAFNKMGKPFSHLTQEGKRQIKSLALAGVLSIDNPQLRNTIIQVTIWSYDKAEDILRSLNTLPSKARTARANAGLHIRLHALNLSAQSARLVSQLEKAAINGAHLSQLAKQMLGKTLRVGGSADVLLAAGAVFFQGWAYKDSMKEVAEKLGDKKQEALLALGSAGMGVLGASAELVGGIAKGIGAKALAELLLKTGGILAAIASAIDGVQAFLAAYRTGKKGDTDAMQFYIGAGIVFAIAAGFALKAAFTLSITLLGPLGVALALVAVGVWLTWAALNAEDTPVQIWLDRCAFGNGKRSEGKWTDAQFEQELAELNAIMLGLKAELEWEDNWGYDSFKTRITFPGFNGNNSAYEYTISAKDKRGSWQTVINEKYGLTSTSYDSWSANDARQFKISKPAFKKKDGNMIVQHDFLLDDNLYSEAKVAVRYYPNKNDPQAEARLTLEQID